MGYLDVGGGLGVDYDGSRTNFESSMNYTLGEYARDVVFNIRRNLQRLRCEGADIVTESGFRRRRRPPLPMLVVEVFERINKLTNPSANSTNPSRATRSSTTWPCC